MTGVTAPLAVLAGVVSFASPCFLPIVPVFVAYLVGTDAHVSRRRTALAQALTFVLGFSVVFVGLWASIGLVGYLVGDHRDLLRIAGGIVLVVMGLHVAGLVRLPFLERQLRAPMRVDAGQAPTYRRSALLGLAFGAGWTPCIGPILGGVLGLATVGESVGQGTALLVAYSVGLGVPFVLVALGATAVSRRLAWLTRHQGAVGAVSGLFLGVTGFLMITDLFSRLAGLAPAFGL